MLSQHKTYIIAILVLFICSGTRLLAFQKPTPAYHQVQKGETLYQLSRTYQTSVALLREFNDLSSDKIEVGQQLIVAVDQARAVAADTINAYEQLVDRLKALSEALAQSVTNGEAEVTQPEEMSGLFQLQPVKAGRHMLQNEIFEQQAAQLRADWGLQTTAGFTHNFEPGFVDAEEVFFDSRLSAGLSWELLGNGLLGNQKRAEALQKQKALNDLLKNESARKDNYTYHYNHLIYTFNKQRADQLKARIRFIRDFLKVAADLYYVRSVSMEEIVKLKAELTELNRALESVESYNSAFESAYADLVFDTYSAVSLPLLNVDPETMLALPGADSLKTEALTLERARLALENHQLKNVSLKAQVRYNTLTGGSQTTRSYASAGFSLSAPLFRNRRSERIQEAKLDLMEVRQQQQSATTNNELINLYYEYEYALKQYISFQGKISVLQERLKGQSDRRLMLTDDYSPLGTVRLLTELQQVNYELIDIKQKLYLNLLKMFTLSGAASIADFCSPYLPERGEEHHQKAVYLWSDSFEKLDLNFVLRYLANNEMNRLMLSAGTAGQKEKQLLKQAAAQEVSVFKLIGENSYITKGFTPALADKVNTLDPMYDGIHLDVEPHALEGWEDHKEAYLDSLVAVFSAVRQRLPAHRQLSVSIPVFFPESSLLQIASLADEVVVMAYGSTDVDKIAKRLKQELQLTGTKITIALRATDFSNRLALEAMIRDLKTKTGISDIMIHDLGSLVMLDQKTILGDLTSEQ